MKDLLQLRSTRENTIFSNDLRFNQAVFENQCLSRYEKKGTVKEKFPSQKKVKTSSLLRRNKSLQCQISQFHEIKQQHWQITNSIKPTENHQISTQTPKGKADGNSILSRNLSGDLNIDLTQKRKRLTERRNEKINFISDRLNILNKINDQLNQLKGEISVNKMLEKNQQQKKNSQYYLNSIIRNNYNDSKLQKKSLHYSHFEKNFLTLQYLENEHHLVSRPPACKKIIKLNEFNIQILPTLVLDLDETLIWTEKSQKMIIKNAIYLKDSAGKQVRHEVHLRPHVKKFLEQMSNFYQIILFTSGSLQYINQVMRFLDPQRKYISQVLSRDHAQKFTCPKFEVHVKDLRVLNRNLSRTVFVDNCIYSYALQLENGIPIIPFNGNPKDNELEGLSEYLKDLQNYSDIAQRNDQVFMQSKFKNYFNRKIDTKTIITSLYSNKLSAQDNFSINA